MNIDKYTLSDTDLAEKLNDSSIDRVMAIDSDWNIIAWNRTSELISGFLKHDLLGNNLLMTFPQIREDQEMMTAIKDAFAGKKSFLPSSHGSFNRQYVENHFIPLRNEQKQIIGVMNIMHDVAHRIKVEKQLQKLNTALEKKYIQLEKANNDLATFTYIAGRDIKEPIKHVYTSLELMARKEGNNLSNTSKGNLRKIQASLNRMNLLLDDIMAISRVSSYNVQHEVVQLNDLLETIKKDMADKLNAKSVELTIIELPAIKGSPEMLTYLFHHLIGNAIKFQQPDNKPVIQVSSVPVTLEDAACEPGEYYEISLTDNGVGFEPKDSDRIFHMFERLDENNFRGSGIGLAICKKILDTHDGIIKAESRPGLGSTFKCYFPVSMDE